MLDKFEEFVDFCIRHSLVPAAQWTGAPRSQIIEISGCIKDSRFVPLNFLIYVVTDKSQGWWGITHTVYDKLIASGRDWYLVLIGDAEDSYLLSGTQVAGMKHALPSSDGQYHMNGMDADRGLRFNTFEELCRALTSSGAAVQP